MSFYTQQHQYYYGIDLHARSMYVCILKAIHGCKANNDKIDAHKTCLPAGRSLCCHGSHDSDGLKAVRTASMQPLPRLLNLDTPACALHADRCLVQARVPHL